MGTTRMERFVHRWLGTLRMIGTAPLYRRSARENVDDCLDGRFEGERINVTLRIRPERRFEVKKLALGILRAEISGECSLLIGRSIFFPPPVAWARRANGSLRRAPLLPSHSNSRCAPEPTQSRTFPRRAFEIDRRRVHAVPTFRSRRGVAKIVVAVISSRVT